MKTKLIRNIFAIALILSTSFSCSKFEDGPKISLRSVEKRIYGVYKIEYISKNGVDITSIWNTYYDLQFDFHYDETGSWPNIYGAYVSGFIDSCGTFKRYGFGYYLGLLIEKEDVKIWMYNAIDTIDFPGRLFYPLIIAEESEPVMFTISRLTNSEMWLKHEDENDLYEIHLKE
jgi:hypothetical protein